MTVPFPYSLPKGPHHVEPFVVCSGSTLHHLAIIYIYASLIHLLEKNKNKNKDKRKLQILFSHFTHTRIYFLKKKRHLVGFLSWLPAAPTRLQAPSAIINLICTVLVFFLALINLDLIHTSCPYH